jgi:processive 1,2-diacylglycerol beta-glucosyltransferase
LQPETCGSEDQLRVLVTYASSGSGHRRAAEAIYSALRIIAPDAESRLIDSLDFTNGFFKWVYPATYLFMVRYLPPVWGFFYYLLDVREIYPLVAATRRLSNFLNAKRFADFLGAYAPDIVITTHFLANEVISDLKRRKKIHTRLICVVTDFRLHSFWVSRQVDTYVVATENTQKELVEWRIKPEVVRVLGIPINPKFGIHKDRKGLSAKLGIASDKFTILLVSGGFGVGPMEQFVLTLNELTIDCQLLIVCGANELLRQRILKVPFRMMAKVYGFVDNMDELMGASDLLITKAGGLTVSEALASDLPMILVAPIPGQETRNSEVLTERGCAVNAHSVGEATEKIIELFTHHQILSRMKENIHRLAKPDAAKDIARLLWTRC